VRLLDSCALRALACLLRSKEVDILAVWWVGLEMLLRRGDEGVWTGFKEAVQYLERLVRLYPYQPRLHSQHSALHRPHTSDLPPVNLPRLRSHWSKQAIEMIIKSEKAQLIAWIDPEHGVDAHDCVIAFLDILWIWISFTWSILSLCGSLVEALDIKGGGS
jgi:hypothetical protein